MGGNMSQSSKGMVTLFVTAVLVGATGCAKSNGFGDGYVGAGMNVNTQTGDFPIKSEKVVQQDVNSGNLSRPTPPENQRPGAIAPTPAARPDQAESLVFGFPAKLLDKPMQFGGVITQVSDQNSEDLGGLKLTDLPPFQVTAVLARDSGGKTGLFLLNCDADCSATPNEQKDAVIGLPVTAVDNAKQVAFVNLAAMGAQLDFAKILQKQGHPTLKPYSSVAAKTLAFDFSQNTLVFDIESTLSKAGSPDLKVTTRWYLKLGDTFDPNFVSRSPRPEAGFFQTERSEKPLIQRFNLEGNAKKGVTEKYFIKNVPDRFKPAFAAAFDLWNERFEKLFGSKLYSYEFVPENDPRNALLVPGDPRFNIVEWDLVNRAGYGGLGPSIAHQYTGEEFSANVLIQGPHIVDLYTAWFEAYGKSTALRNQGFVAQADQLLANTRQALSAEVEQLGNRQYSVKFAGHEMMVRSQQPAYEDPAAQRDDFDIVPEGVTFDEYMSGYFTDMLAHELGHNLGLRHNFRGNLGAGDSTVRGQVSRSVMEYLGRPYRYLDGLGDYDTMAVLFGYQGVAPTHSDWFCTDEDKADLNDPTKSAECTSEDATNDPYSFWTDRLAREVNLLTAPGQATAPIWSVADMDKETKSVFTGLGVYAVSAEATASGWTNFFGKPGRPANAAGVKAYVLESIKASFCGEAIEAAIAAKTSAAARAKAQKNVDDLHALAVDLLKKVFTPAELACQ